MKNTLYFLFLGIILSTFACSKVDDSSNAEIEKLRAKIAETEQKIKETTMKKTGLIHTVFFWLKEDLTDDQKAKFMAGVNSLKSISHINESFSGPAAGTENRDVVDHSYSLALICHFEDKAAQDAYQIDPIHLKFVDDCKDLWRKVVVYDSLVE